MCDIYLCVTFIIIEFKIAISCVFRVNSARQQQQQMKIHKYTNLNNTNGICTHFYDLKIFVSRNILYTTTGYHQICRKHICIHCWNCVCMRIRIHGNAHNDIGLYRRENQLFKGMIIITMELFGKAIYFRIFSHYFTI